MKEKALQLLQQARDIWASLSTAKRIALLVVSASVLIGVIAFSYFSAQEKYAYLFTDLSAEDASAIAAKLKELKVPMRVDAGGTAVMVPEEKVHELRLTLAGQGLPRGGGVGFELFDKSHFGATEFEQRIHLRRALEGELARTISTVGAVQSARVHLVLPERSVFAISREEASASVVLRLRQGRTFGKPEVAAVLHLVASAVPGLSADRVSIVSAEGLTLHRPRTDASKGGVGGDDSTIEREREMSASMEEHVRALIERVVGPGHADVRIHVALDTSNKERTEEHYEPTKTALRSEQKTEERSSTEGASVAGVPGAQSNLPDEQESPPEGESEGGGAARTSWTRNWEVDRVTEKTTIPAGRVARLSIAVLVDGHYNGPIGAKAYAARDKAELDRLGELVKGAVGFDAARGDVIQVDSAEFAKADDATPADVKDGKRIKLPWWAYAAAGGAVLVIGSVVVLVWRRRRRARLAEEQSEPDALPEGEETLLLTGEGPAKALPRAMTKEDSRVLRSEAIELAARDPATAAVILREWLNAPSNTPVAARF